MSTPVASKAIYEKCFVYEVLEIKQADSSFRIIFTKMLKGTSRELSLATLQLIANEVYTSESNATKRFDDIVRYAESIART